LFSYFFLYNFFTLQRQTTC